MNIISKESLQEYFTNRGFTPQIFNQDETNTQSSIYNISIIQSFYGLNPKRITATTKALEAMLDSTVKPEEWIFIESQKFEEDCCFKWLKRFGIIHKFIQMTDDQDGIFLKTPLWNIGASFSKSDYLCFIDSDISFCNSSWLKDIKDKFESGYEVLSLHGFSYYENLINPSEINESTGHSLEKDKNGNSYHYGLTIGLTQNLFKRIGGFRQSFILDDLDYWTKIVGNKPFENIVDSWKINKENQLGFKVKVGSTEQVVCHCEHGDESNRKRRQLVDVCLGRTDDINEVITYTKTDINKNFLPKWNLKTKFGQIVKQSIISINEMEKCDKTGTEVYFENAKEIFGEPSEDEPLIISTVFKSGFSNDIEDLIKINDSLLQDNSNIYGFVVFSDEKEGIPDNIDVIPYKDNELDFMQIFRDDVVFPENSNVLFVPYDILNKGFKIDNICICEKNKIAISKNGCIYLKYTKKFISKIRKLTKVGRNVDEFLYFNKIKPEKIGKYLLSTTI